MENQQEEVATEAEAPVVEEAQPEVETPVEPQVEIPSLELNIEEPPAEPEIPPLDQSRRVEIGREWAETKGELSDETWEYLEGQKLNREFVQDYMSAQQELEQYRQKDLVNRLGGADGIQQAMDWANENLPVDRKTALNAQLASGDLGVMENTLRGLMAQAGIVGSVVRSNVNNNEAGLKPIESQDELVKLQMSKEYKESPAFRKQVMDRLRVSKF